MLSHIRNPLVLVWAILTLSTVVSWYISKSDTLEFQANAWVTLGVLVIAIIKAQMVIRYFMEVKVAPSWLKATMTSWSSMLLLLLLGFYFLTN